MIEKQIFINKYLNLFEDGDLAVFSDADVKFYGKIKGDLTSCLGDRDICFMKDHNSDVVGWCGGFFVVRVSHKIRAFFQNVMDTLSSYDSSEEGVAFETSEQSTINDLINDCPEISCGWLPQRYYTHGLYTNGINNFSEEDQSGLWWLNKSWDEKTKIFDPEEILVHHANWCGGIKNKIDLLKWVNEIVELRS